MAIINLIPIISITTNSSTNTTIINLYLFNPSIISNINFYVPIMIILALSPFFIWFVSILLIRKPKIRFFIDIVNLIYSIFLMTILLPSFFGYSLTQIYQLINTVEDINLIMYIYNMESMLSAIYAMVSTFSLFYYIIGILFLIVDTSLLWT